MAKKMKKVLCCLVVLMILTSAMPVSVFAVQESSSSETVSAQGDCSSVVKFKGTTTTDENNVGFICYGSYYCKVKVEELLSNPGNKLKSGNVYTVCYGDSSKSIKNGDTLEVYGEYFHTCGALQNVGNIVAYNDGYYIKKIEKKKPDLIIKDISWSPSSPDKGDTITFTVKIKNQGSGSAGSSTVKYYIDGSYVGSDSVSKLSAGSTSTETFTWTASKCGNVKVKAVADANNDVYESGGNNNDRTETVSIKCPTLKPDLIIQDISWSPSNPDDGDTIAFTVTIKNQGSGSAGSSTVKYYVDGSYVGSDSVPALSAGSTSTQTFTWTANKCGNVQVKAVADANNAVSESNDGNNDRTETINVICGEKPAPEIIKVIYPTTCVKEGEAATISVTVNNNGGASSEGYISLSFPNDEQIYDVSGTGSTYNKLYPKGSWIWNSKDQQMESVDPLVELLDTNWVKGQQETITMNVKPNSGYDEIVFYVRAALKNADGTYERDPTYSGYTDQQGWYVKKYAIGICPKEACVIIDDDTCVGYKVYVDDVYQLTEGVGETLDGSCTFYVAEGTHTIEIRDNGRYTSITRNFEGTYTWNTMPDNWCKCNAEVKFRGVIVKESLPISFYNYKVKIEEILEDPTGVLSPGDEVWVWAHADGPAQVDPVSVDDQVEVYGTYDGEPHREVKLDTGEEYLRALKVSFIIDDDTCVGYEVWVDGTYKLTDGDGDGYCSFSVTEGTHTIEIRDNDRHTSITRNFKGTHTWNSMPDNWCKGNAAVKFNGVIVKESLPISFYNYKVKIDEILEDPSSVLNTGDEIWVWAHADGPAQVDSVGIDDKVEVSGIYDGELHREVKLERAEHYLKEGSQEPGIIYVDDDFVVDDPPNHKWNTIQEGINDAEESDTVFVYSGTYYSGKWYGPISITKNGLKLIGEDRDTTIIDGNGEGDVITLRSNNTLISNFTIRNSCSGNGAGISLRYSSNEISNNIISFNGYGISTSCSDNNTIRNNLVSNNDYYGMLIWLSMNNTIIENTISDNYIGIYTHSMFCYHSFYHNNFIDNECQADDSDWEENCWCNKELMEGNYWSDYEKKYPDAEDKDGNGIWDTPYEIPGREWAGRKDNYPLVRPYGKLKPDLTITDISWNPRNPEEGDEVSFNYTIKNQGYADAADFIDALYIEGERYSISVRESVKAGESKDRVFTRTWTATCGDHTIMVVADDLGEIEELNERNNQSSETVNVACPNGDIRMVDHDRVLIKENTEAHPDIKRSEYAEVSIYTKRCSSDIIDVYVELNSIRLSTDKKTGEKLNVSFGEGFNKGAITVLVDENATILWEDSKLLVRSEEFKVGSPPPNDSSYIGDPNIEEPAKHIEVLPDGTEVDYYKGGKIAPAFYYKYRGEMPYSEWDASYHIVSLGQYVAGIIPYVGTLFTIDALLRHLVKGEIHARLLDKDPLEISVENYDEILMTWMGQQPPSHRPYTCDFDAIVMKVPVKINPDLTHKISVRGKASLYVYSGYEDIAFAKDFEINEGHKLASPVTAGTPLAIDFESEKGSLKILDEEIITNGTKQIKFIVMELSSNDDPKTKYIVVETSQIPTLENEKLKAYPSMRKGFVSIAIDERAQVNHDSIKTEYRESQYFPRQPPLVPLHYPDMYETLPELNENNFNDVVEDCLSLIPNKYGKLFGLVDTTNDLYLYLRDSPEAVKQAYANEAELDIYDIVWYNKWIITLPHNNVVTIIPVRFYSDKNEIVVRAGVLTKHYKFIYSKKLDI